ncbi:glycosyltransferase family 39 protein [Flavobacterium album]|nr:glycosyltransferase family 39 protein [Flavobacterium album]
MNEADPAATFTGVYSNIKQGEQMPPLYFYLVYYLFKVFGYKTIVARLFSAVLGCISIYALYLLGKELFSRRAGYVAAILLSVNYFGLFYSQEARPYAMLLLFSIAAFYRLVLFIKNPTLKNAVFHGIFSAMMIYGHFFGLMAYMAQYSILLLFLVLTEPGSKLRFFRNIFVSGVVALIILIPAIPVFIEVIKIKEFWIPRPGPDTFTLMFKEFFGSSEMVLMLVLVFFVSYIASLVKQKQLKLNYITLIGNKTLFSFIIIIPWLAIPIIIALIKSYASSTSVLISRYFIVLLPAVIMMLTIGAIQFRNKIIQYTLITLFVILSLSDIIVVKKYYTSILKSQFRETADFVKENNESMAPVVTSLPWHLKYFLNNNEYKSKIINSSLEEYVANLENDPKNIKDFWYIDGHGKTYSLSERGEAMLAKYYDLETNFEGMDAWARFYVLKTKTAKTLDIKKFGLLKPVNGDKITFNFDFYEQSGNKLKASGWAFLEGIDASATKYRLILIKDGVAINLRTERIPRPDVTKGFDKGFDLDSSGFRCEAELTDIPSGSYTLGIYMINKEKHKEGLVVTDKIIQKN